LSDSGPTIIGPEVADSLAIDYFIDAIPESDIRLRLKEVGPKTMSEAENLAVYCRIPVLEHDVW
jgi:hypothetical protein